MLDFMLFHSHVNDIMFLFVVLPFLIEALNTTIPFLRYGCKQPLHLDLIIKVVIIFSYHNINLSFEV